MWRAIYVYAEHLPPWLLRGAAHPSNSAVYDDSNHGTSVYFVYILTRMSICFEGLHVCVFVCVPLACLCLYSFCVLCMMVRITVDRTSRALFQNFFFPRVHEKICALM